jgi:hypothetical protein
MNVPGLENSGMKRVTSLRYVQMMPSPLTGSGVEVRHTVEGVRNIKGRIYRGRADRLSTFWKVKIPRRSNCLPLLVTVKLRLIPVQDPGAPQSVGGLKAQCQRGQVVVCAIFTDMNWTTSALKVTTLTYTQTLRGREPEHILSE